MTNENIFVDTCLEYVYENNDSDLHLKANNKPYARKIGKLFPINDHILTDDDIVDFVNKYSIKKIDKADYITSVDFSFQYKDVRFRVNAFHDHNGFCAAVRQLKLFSTDFDVLGLPEKLKELASRPNGLILVTGPTGSGKSTTLAAVLDYINKNFNKHIVTVEDPIEYMFEPAESIITQREVNVDTPSFEASLIDALREDPDVIVIGEMRDKESIEAALVAAETGHLVFSTLHTKNSTSTISRIVDMFPSEKQNQILNQLSSTLAGIISQKLIPSVDYDRLHLATELLIVNNAIASNIKQNKTSMVESMIELGKNEGMYLMHSSVEKLLKDRLISKEEAEKHMY